MRKFEQLTIKTAASCRRKKVNMSLCVLLRDSNGGAMMAADTALIVEFDGVKYRVQNHEDAGKVINCHGNLLFISGIYDYAVELREFAKNMDPFDLEELQSVAIKILESGKYPVFENKDEVIVLVCLKDNRVACMRASSHFEISYNDAPPDSAMNILTMGAMAEEAFQNAKSFASDTEWGLPLIGRTFDSVLCEEVGGGCNIIQRLADGCMIELNGRLHDPDHIKKVTVRTHGIIHASDGVFNGEIYARGGKFTGEIEAATIKAATLDGKLVGGTNGLIEGIGINIGNGAFTVDTGGNAVMSGDLTLSGNINLSNGNITWGNNGPVKYQFSTSASGPWHSDMAADDKYRRDSVNGGTTWGSAYQFRGTDGANGRNGSDASVTYAKIKEELQKAASIDSAYLTMDEVGAPIIRGGEIYGATFYAGDGSKNLWATIANDGFSLTGHHGTIAAISPSDANGNKVSSSGAENARISSYGNIILHPYYGDVYIKHETGPVRKVLTEGAKVTAVFA